MLLLYKSYNYINKQKHFKIKSRVVGRGARGLRGSRGFSRYPDESLSHLSFYSAGIDFSRENLTSVDDSDD